MASVRAPVAMGSRPEPEGDRDDEAKDDGRDEAGDERDPPTIGRRGQDVGERDRESDRDDERDRVGDPAHPRRIGRRSQAVLQPGVAGPAYRLRSARTNSTVPTIVKTRKKPIVIARSTIGGWSTAAAYSGLPQ